MSSKASDPDNLTIENYIAMFHKDGNGTINENDWIKFFTIRFKQSMTKKLKENMPDFEVPDCLQLAEDERIPAVNLITSQD